MKRASLAFGLLAFGLTSMSSTLAHADPCVADFDDGSGTGTPDGAVTVDDLLFYLELFDQADLRANIDHNDVPTTDPVVTIDDLLLYLLHFSEGC